MLLIDLDGFKAVNDTHGHEAGDEVLRAIAGRLKECIRTADTVARVGGDEFILILNGLTRAADAGAVAAKILAAVARPIPPLWTADQAATPVQISCSIGISLYPRDAADPDGLIRLADAAMYQAKQGGRGRFVHSA